MKIAERHLDKITIFDISGDIDLATSPQLRKALLRELRERVPFVTLIVLAWRRSWRASKLRAMSAHA